MTRFLKRLWTLFVGSASNSDTTAEFAPNERLARFLFSRDDFSSTKNLVKPRGFYPEIYQNRDETSVFRVSVLPEGNIWGIGKSIRGIEAKARGDIQVTHATEAKLQVEMAPQTHQRHAVLVNWPAQKHEKKMVATRLSQKAILRLSPK